jgi:hypothetical protein
MSVWQVLAMSVAILGIAGLLILAFVSKGRPGKTTGDRGGPDDRLTAIGSAPGSDVPAGETTDSWFWH